MIQMKRGASFPSKTRDRRPFKCKSIKSDRKTGLFRQEVLSLILAVLFTVGGKFIFSLPMWLILLSGLKIKGFTALQFYQLYRLIQFMKNNAGRFSQGQFGQTQGSSSVTTDEAYKLLVLKKGASKEEVLKAANQLQKKIPSKRISVS